MYGRFPLGPFRRNGPVLLPEPAIEVALERVVAVGYRHVVYYPYGFLADNAESELEGRIALSTVADLEARHLPCLNDSPGLMAILAQQIRQLPVG